MKRTLALIGIMLISLFSQLKADSCGSSSYHRVLTNSHYTWYFDSTSLYGCFYGRSHTDRVTRNDIRGWVAWAISEWSGAANSEGTRIIVDEGTLTQHDIFITFENLGYCGDGLYPYIKLNRWDNWSRDGLKTTILHEMGHIYLGSGHDGDEVMSPTIGNDGTCAIVSLSIGNCESKWALDLYNPEYTIGIKNVFGDTSGGGVMNVDGQPISLDSTDYTHVTRRDSEFPLTLTAVIGQYSGGFPQNFTEWTEDGSGTDLSISIGAVGNYTAIFKDLYTVTVQTSGPAGAFAGKVKINGGAEVNSPATIQVQQDNAVGVQVTTSQIVDYLAYTFTNWTPGNHATQPHDYYPNRTSYTYTANFTLKPLAVQNLLTGGAVGTPVHVTWSEHANGNVDLYKIWRQVKHNGVLGSPGIIATVYRGTTSYTDYDYLMTNGYTDDIVWYDARAHLSTPDSYADPQWYANYAEFNPAKVQFAEEKSEQSESSGPDGVCGILSLPFFSLGNIPKPSLKIYPTFLRKALTSNTHLVFIPSKSGLTFIRQWRIFGYGNHRNTRFYQESSRYSIG